MPLRAIWLLRLFVLAGAVALVELAIAIIAQRAGLDRVSPQEVTRRTIQLGVPVIIARIVVYVKDAQRAKRTGRPRRTNDVWTFGLPTALFGLWLLRIDVAQSLDLFGPQDWITPASYVGVIGGQVVATVYQWMPPEVGERLGRRLRGDAI